MNLKINVYTFILDKINLQWTASRGQGRARSWAKICLRDFQILFFPELLIGLNFC